MNIPPPPAAENAVPVVRSLEWWTTCYDHEESVMRTLRLVRVEDYDALAAQLAVAKEEMEKVQAREATLRAALENCILASQDENGHLRHYIKDAEAALSSTGSGMMEAIREAVKAFDQLVKDCKEGHDPHEEPALLHMPEVALTALRRFAGE